ncbi:ABC transporter permease [Nocardioides sp.]|uniref:ABC transporter permease n=1 Tax=Nocardioides sp. TaxID=35761 RepID=UPI00351873A5
MTTAAVVAGHTHRRRRWAAGAVGALALAWLLVPLLPVLVWAAAERWPFPDVLPSAWGLVGWREAVDAGLPAALLRSAGLGLAVAALATPLGLMLGRVLGWGLVRRRGLLVTVLLLPLVLPAFAVAMGLDVVVLRVGVPDRLAVVLVLATMALPYTALTTAAGFARTSPDLAAQARALGATPGRARRQVVLPALRGSIVVAALLAFLVGWSDYVVTVLIGGGQLVTAPVLLGSAAAGSGNEPVTAALAVATLVPPVVLVLLAGATGRGRRAR